MQNSGRRQPIILLECHMEAPHPFSPEVALLSQAEHKNSTLIASSMRWFASNKPWCQNNVHALREYSCACCFRTTQPRNAFLGMSHGPGGVPHQNIWWCVTEEGQDSSHTGTAENSQLKAAWTTMEASTEVAGSFQADLDTPHRQPQLLHLSNLSLSLQPRGQPHQKHSACPQVHSCLHD